MFCDENIIKYGQLSEKADVLEGAGNSLFRDPVRRTADDRNRSWSNFSQIHFLHFSLWCIGKNGLSHKIHLPKGRFINTGNTVECSCLSCTVGADQGHDLTLVYVKGQTVYSHNAAELHSDVLHVKHIDGRFFCF